MLDVLSSRKEEMELMQNNVIKEFICAKICQTMTEEAERLCANPSVLVFSRNLELVAFLESLQSLTEQGLSENHILCQDAGEVDDKSEMKSNVDTFAALKLDRECKPSSILKSVNAEDHSRSEMQTKFAESKDKNFTDVLARDTCTQKMEEETTSASTETTETIYFRRTPAEQQTKQGPYIVTKKEHFNAFYKDDTNFIDIISSCILDSGDIILVDMANENLKLLRNKTYKVKHTFKVSSKPYSISSVKGSEAAVCLSNNTIQFVCAEDKIVPKHTLRMDHFCRGICVRENEMFITDGKNHVFIYTLEGVLKKPIVIELKTENKLFNFQQSREVDVSGDGKIVYVTDMTQGLIAINRNGKELWRYSDRKLDCPNGVCTDGGNSIFVCGVDSYNIIQIGLNGQYEGEILSRSEGLEYTSTISFYKKDKKIVIGGSDDQIHIYSLE